MIGRKTGGGGSRKLPAARKRDNTTREGASEQEMEKYIERERQGGGRGDWQKRRRAGEEGEAMKDLFARWQAGPSQNVAGESSEALCGAGLSTAFCCLESGLQRERDP